jgi:hypothetical protein
MKETPQESAMEVTVIKAEEEEDSCQPLALVTPNNRKHFPPTSALVGVTELLPSSPLADEATVSTTTPSEATAAGGGGGAGTPPDSTHHQQHTHTHLVSSSQATGSFKTTKNMFLKNK